MIDTRTESLLTLAEAGELVRKHVATIYRWSTTGFRGIVLETLQVGGTRCTTREALQRFCERLTNTPRSTKACGSSVLVGSEKAAVELERYGI